MRSLALFLALGTACAASAVAAGDANTAPPEALRARLLAARELLAATGEAVWPGWEAPFEALLLDGESEFLVGRDVVPEGFESAGTDPVLGHLASRDAVLPPQLLATMPLFGPPATIVVGTPETTGKAPGEWLLVLLHEHFHQWQMRDPAYFTAVAGLDLDGGDTTGRWMLDYPFPYDDPGVGEAFADLSRRLGALLSDGDGDPAALWHDHGAFVAALDPGAARYLDFQLWQEGVARFVELRVAEEGVARRSPAAEDLSAAARDLRQELMSQLAAPDLAALRRVSFYAYGAGLALLLERTEPGWKERYETPRFHLAPPSPLD
jgi:hypothetical protein